MTTLQPLAFLLSTCLLGMAVACADSWTITQGVDVTSDTTFSQSGSNSLQAANAINLNSSTGTVASASQTANFNGHNITLTQDGSSNQQAVNLISAAHITDATQAINNAGAVLLKQQGSGSDNTQALNIAIATGSATQIDKINQTVNAASVSFANTGSGTGNIQAGNYLQAESVSASASNIKQSFDITGNVTYGQSGKNNLQAGNAVISNSLASANVTQHYSANSISVDTSFYSQESNNSSSTYGSISAANYVGKKPLLQ